MGYQISRVDLSLLLRCMVVASETRQTKTPWRGQHSVMMVVAAISLHAGRGLPSNVTTQYPPPVQEQNQIRINSIVMKRGNGFKLYSAERGYIEI